MALSSLGIAACAALLGVDDVGYRATDADASTGGPAETSTDGVPPGGSPGDAAVDAGEYHNVQDSADWSTFDLASLNPAAKGYLGAVFDGRYITFVPHGIAPDVHGLAVRYDARAAFDAGAAWSIFDIAGVADGGQGFAGAAFDGRTITFAPNSTGTSKATLAALFDTQGSLLLLPSWSTFETTNIAAGAGAFFGGAFDGRYIYLVPYGAPGLFNGVILRHDAKQDAGWSSFNVSVIDSTSTLVGFKGAVFDGRFLYLVPYEHPTVARYDTQATFNTPEAWTPFDVAQITVDPIGFAGGVFDGRYVYFIPATTLISRVIRYDTKAKYDALSSWTSFDTTSLAGRPRGFFGGAFDGRYVYLVPSNDGAPTSVLVRYDTLDSFEKTPAWTTFDVAKVHPAAKGFAGAAFDGRYLYLVPHEGSIVARFDARTFPMLPGTLSGSSF